MGFGISMESGEGGAFLPLLTFDAKSGDLCLKTKGADGEWDIQDIGDQQPTFAVDYGSLEIGWIAYTKPPVFLVVPHGKPQPARPEVKGIKQGIRVKVAGKALGGVREFSTTSKTVLRPFDALHTLFENAPEAAEGMIPVVKFAGKKSVRISTPEGMQTFKEPILEVVQWVPRNADILGPRTVPPPAAKAAPAAAPAVAARGGGEIEDTIPFNAEWR